MPKTAPPIAKIEPSATTYHNITKIDNYAWLRAKNWQEVLHKPELLNQDIRNYLEAENKYQSDFMSNTVEFQKQLFKELKGRIKEDDSSVPIKHDDYSYGVRYNIGVGLPDFFRINLFDNNEQVYLCGEQIKKLHHGENSDAYFQIGTVSHSLDHKKFVFAYDDKGSEYYNLKIKSFNNDVEYNYPIKNTSGNIAWDSNSKGFFYIKLNEQHRPFEVYYHTLNSEQSQDILIYKEEDIGYFLSLNTSPDKKYIFISIHNHETSESWLLNASAPFEKPICVKPREPKLEYYIKAGEEKFYILTNKDNAKDFKIMQADKAQLLNDDWQEYIEHKPGRLINHIALLHNYLLWLETENGLPNIKYCTRTNKDLLENLSVEEEVYDLDLLNGYEYYTDEIRYSYSSPTTPLELYSFNLKTKQRELLKTQIVPSGHNKTQYITKRLMAPAKDGELIPISIYYHKDTKLDGTAPCLLYGYGAYGISIPNNFNTNSLSLVARGFIYAVAHIRGGKEKGTYWYENGKYQDKKNSFTDFITSARFLVENNYTNHKKLIAYGGSAGGMLMGAVANMAPQDFFSIIAIVPFVDVLNTMLDDTLPLTPPEWPEWGNPIKNKADYELIASYSPYDNIKEQNYPYILAIAGLTDPRVTYWEAAKWVAKLRAYKTDSKSILLRLNMDSGHAGSADRFDKLKETAYIYAYILKLLEKKGG